MAQELVCEFCDRSFGSLPELQQHLESAHAGRPWAARCDVCQRTFESPADLKAHNENVHHSGR
jgi:hypothetical protein